MIKKSQKNTIFRRFSFVFVAICFIVMTAIPSVYAQMIAADTLAYLNMPAPGMMIEPTAPYAPALMKGVRVFPDEPLRFDFLMDRGDSGLDGDALQDEYSEMIKYFLASLTLPDEEMWVNLSPYEKDRIIPESFGLTEMGRDLLAQDYVLKQLTASLLYPEREIGKMFWDRVYQKAYQEFGTTQIPVDTFNKVWIVPEQAEVYVNENVAYVVKSKLKVMLEQDYLAANAAAVDSSSSEAVGQDQQTIAKEIMRKVILPEIEKEINEGKHFAKLRQIYHSLILAIWFKRNLKKSFLGQIYVEKSKVNGIDVKDKDVKQKIYQQYLSAFKKGVYDFIKEDIDQSSKKMIPRRYFSGGTDIARGAQAVYGETDVPPEGASVADGKSDVASVVLDEISEGKQGTSSDRTMMSRRGFLKSGVNLALDVTGVAAIGDFLACEGGCSMGPKRVVDRPGRYLNLWGHTHIAPRTQRGVSALVSRIHKLADNSNIDWANRSPEERAEEIMRQISVFFEDPMAQGHATDYANEVQLMEKELATRKYQFIGVELGEKEYEKYSGEHRKEHERLNTVLTFLNQNGREGEDYKAMIKKVRLLAYTIPSMYLKSTGVLDKYGVVIVPLEDEETKARAINRAVKLIEPSELKILDFLKAKPPRMTEEQRRTWYAFSQLALGMEESKADEYAKRLHATFSDLDVRRVLEEHYRQLKKMKKYIMDQRERRIIAKLAETPGNGLVEMGGVHPEGLEKKYMDQIGILADTVQKTRVPSKVLEDFQNAIDRALEQNSKSSGEQSDPDRAMITLGMEEKLKGILDRGKIADSNSFSFHMPDGQVVMGFEDENARQIFESTQDALLTMLLSEILGNMKGRKDPHVTLSAQDGELAIVFSNEEEIHYDRLQKELLRLAELEGIRGIFQDGEHFFVSRAGKGQVVKANGRYYRDREKVEASERVYVRKVGVEEIRDRLKEEGWQQWMRNIFGLTTRETEHAMHGHGFVMIQGIAESLGGSWEILGEGDPGYEKGQTSGRLMIPAGKNFRFETTTDVGGIDLNPDALDLSVSGKDVSFDIPLEFQNVDPDTIFGFTPVILNIMPATNLPMFLGLQEDEGHEQKLSALP